MAEANGQILKIDHWVIKNTFEFVAKYNKKNDLVTSINLSTKTICSKKTLNYIINCFDSFDIKPHQIEFEVTEHSLITDIDQSLSLIKSLKEIGFKISLDDFGTRYSSLNYLSLIPFDKLKIDKSYIDRVVKHKTDQIIVEHIISLSKNLGIETVAEGIEIIDQYRLLNALGCDYGQGYLLQRPMAEDAIIHYM